MPMVNGYTVYVGGRGPKDWIVRVYRDSDDQHVHSYEGGYSWRSGLEEAADAIEADLRAPTGEAA